MRISDWSSDVCSSDLTGNRLGSAATRAKWLNDTEAALNDTANCVGQLMTSMFSAAETLAANPANQALRTTFLYNINEVVTAFQQTANDLQALSESVGSAGSISISAINDTLTELTRVNEGLRKV